MTANWVVITTINPPSAAVRAFAQMPDWHVVVVGDEKTPKDWACENVVYLRPEDQLGFTLAQYLPWNHYGRKMLGYLYAMRQGADVIADADDDTLPLANWRVPDFDGEWLELGGARFANVYKWYSGQHAWPRGFPLNHINDVVTAKPLPQRRKVGVWQGLVSGEPDVDAIYRLTNNRAICFRDMPSIVLAEGTLCPFNSQNTFWRREMFPLMYLPTSVSSRFSDILRSYITQPVMWAQGYRLGFTGATATQRRNPHDLMVDFRDEIDMYLRAEDAAEIAEDGLGAWARDLEALGV